MTSWGRHELLGFVRDYYDALDVEGMTFLKTLITSPNDPEGPVESRGDWEEIEAYNTPLTDKWNTGVQCISGCDLDAIVIVGSDDLLAPEYFEMLRNVLADGVDYFILSSMYFFDALTGRLALSRYENAGAGRMIARPLLEAVDWTPWHHRGRPDPANYRKCSPLATKEFKPTLDIASRTVALDIKSQNNIWTFDEIAASFDTEILDNPNQTLCEVFGEWGKRLYDWSMTGVLT